MTVVTRFAPSPTGHLHIGGARTALFCYLLARHFDGKFLLRIEDTDTLRSKQEYTDSILSSMSWLGLEHDGELLYQSKRTDIYNEYVEKLLENGDAYYCSCTPEEVEAMREEARAKGEKPKYNGKCRELGLGAGENRVVRLKAPLEGFVSFEDMVKGTINVEASELDDMVLRRSDAMPTYNIAVVIDDALSQVSHVIRGDDHVSNTPKQVLIYKALGFKMPVFGHVPMILGPDKQKLSKRHGARAVIEYEQDGLLSQALVNCLVRLGWSHGDKELFTKQELIDLFDGTNLSSSASAYDPAKLQWLNAHYLRELESSELNKLLMPFVNKIGFECSEEKLSELAQLYKERATDLVELASALSILLVKSSDIEYDAKLVEKHMTDDAKAHLKNLHGLLSNAEFNIENLDSVLNAYVSDNGLKFKQIGPALRVSLSNSTGGPHLPNIMVALGKEESLSRLALFI